MRRKPTSYRSDARDAKRHVPCLVLWLLLSVPSAAQVQRLPSVLPPTDAFPGMLTSNPDTRLRFQPLPGEDRSQAAPEAAFVPYATGPLTPPPVEFEPLPALVVEAGSPAEEEFSILPKDSRPSFFQKAKFEATWMARCAGADALGQTELETTLTCGMPFPERRSPLVITPGFAVHYVDGPADRDLPPRLFDTYVSFRWIRPVTKRLTAFVGITPGVYSDFRQQTDEAFRLTGYGTGIWHYRKDLKLVFGVAYLNREDIKVLPVGGFLWNPRDDFAVEVTLPKPRIAYRVADRPSRLGTSELWAYVGGELGGNRWAIQRETGVNENLNIRDYRVLLGLERKSPLGELTTAFEVGYVFGRDVEFDTARDDFRPDDTVLLRASVQY